jgi:hypothetical protein
MTKGYYIAGAVLIGIAGYFLYNKIKKGNSEFNFINEDIPEDELGSNLEPPMEVPMSSPLN